MIRPHVWRLRLLAPKAHSMFSASGDEFDQWFKRRLADATGLNPPPAGPLPEMLSSYPANDRH